MNGRLDNRDSGTQRVMFAPLWQYTILNATGPAVADARFGAIASFRYTAPYEQIRLKRR